MDAGIALLLSDYGRSCQQVPSRGPLTLPRRATLSTNLRLKRKNSPVLFSTQTRAMEGERLGTWTDIAKEGTLSSSDTAELAELNLPLDVYNATLLDHVHPRAWPDPDPGETVYDLLAVGAGAGGLVSAKQTARRGGRSALIEVHLHGGDCLNVGCVPSKALIRAARAVKEVKHAGTLGVHVENVSVDFPFIMERMRALRARIAPVDSVHLSTSLGVDVFQGKGTFTGSHSLEVNGKTLRFKKAVVATGGSPRVPPIPGLDTVPYVTNKTLFNLTALPPRLIVIGSGPIGVEMAQSFSLFGSQVTVLDLSPKMLPREDPDAARLVQESAEADGCTFVLGVSQLQVSAGDPGPVFPLIKVSFTGADGEQVSLECEALLVATGRTPNVKGLGLEDAGVEYDQFGVKVNDLMQTSNPDIYSVGDCSTKWQFTHMAGTQAQMVVENAIFAGNRTVSSLVIPRCTYTSPEIAAVGESEQDLVANEIEFDKFVANLHHNDRAILESRDSGFCKVLVQKGSGKILGATIVADDAGNMISELTLAMQANVDLGTISRTIHPYPTVAEVIAGCAFQYKVANWKKL